MHIFICYLEQPCIPQRLSRQREKLLHASSLLPHHELLSGRGEVQGGDNVRVVGQLGPDGLTVQLFHTVHNQLPLTLCLGLFHWTHEEEKKVCYVSITKRVTFSNVCHGCPMMSSLRAMIIRFIPVLLI